MRKSDCKILLDADVIIHFCKGDSIFLLPKIFKEEKVILDVVLDELEKRKSLRQYYENLINFRLFKEITFDDDNEVIKEFARLVKQFGKGESACLAYCRYHKDIIGSSNIHDILEYCKKYNIKYYTTMDFLAEGYRQGLLSKEECDFFIYKVKSKGSILPYNTLDEFFIET